MKTEVPNFAAAAMKEALHKKPDQVAKLREILGFVKRVQHRANSIFQMGLQAKAQKAICLDTKQGATCKKSREEM